VISVSDFVEIPGGGMYPETEGSTHKVRYFRNGRKYGAMWRPDDVGAELHAIADETGLMVQYCTSPDYWPWICIRPRLRAQV
jgi:hypothetical protein